MKKEIRIKLDSDLIDRIQVMGNPYLTFGEFIEKILEHIFECEICDIPDLWEKRDDCD